MYLHQPRMLNVEGDARSADVAPPCLRQEEKAMGNRHSVLRTALLTCAFALAVFGETPGQMQSRTNGKVCGPMRSLAN